MANLFQQARSLLDRYKPQAQNLLSTVQKTVQGGINRGRVNIQQGRVTNIAPGRFDASLQRVGNVIQSLPRMELPQAQQRFQPLPLKATSGLINFGGDIIRDIGTTVRNVGSPQGRQNILETRGRIGGILRDDRPIPYKRNPGVLDKGLAILGDRGVQDLLNITTGPLDVSDIARLGIPAAAMAISKKASLIKATGLRKLLPEIRAVRKLVANTANLTLQQANAVDDLVRRAYPEIGTKAMANTRKLINNNPEEYKQFVIGLMDDLEYQALNPEVAMGLSTRTSKKLGGGAQAGLYDAKYLYHGTGETALENISKEGLKPGKTSGKISLSKIEDYSQNWAKGGITPQGKTKGVMLRINQDLLESKILPSKSGVKSDQLNELISKDVIPPQAIEIKQPDGTWRPLVAQQPLSDVTQATKGVGGFKTPAQIMGDTPPGSTIPDSPKTKLEVGGGKYSTERFNVNQKLDTDIRDIAARVEPEISTARGGTKSIQQTIDEAKGISLEDATRGSGKYSGDAVVYAQSSWIKTLTEEIDEIKRIPNADPLTISQLRFKEKQLDDLIVNALGKTSTEAGRTLKAHQYLAETLSDNAQVRLKATVTRNPDRWPETKKVVELLNKFDSNDRVGMIRFLSQVEKSTPLSKVESIWYNNILSGVATQIVNNLGNLGRTFWNITTKPMRVASDVAVSAVTKTPRQEFLREWGPEAIGAVNGLRDGVRRFVQAMKTGIRETDIAELNVPTTALKGKLGAAYSTPSRLLVAFDELFRGINRSMEINRQAFNIAIKEGLEGNAYLKRVGELVANPTPDIAKRADDMASELLYQKASDELTSVGGLRDLIKIDIPKLGTFKPLRFVIPFIQIPVNVAKFGFVETTPAGALTTLMKGEKALGRLEFNRRMGSALIGAVSLSALATYFTEDKITGRPPKTAKERDAFFAQGKQPYSIKIGDRWVQYNRLPDPLASHLSIIGAYHDTFRDSGELPTSEKLQNLATSFVRGLADRTFLAGISDLMNAIEDPERYGGSYVRNLASSLAVPWSSFTGSIARATDRTVRDPQTVKEAIMAKVPGLSKMVSAKESAFEPTGEAIRKYPAYQEFSPVKVTKETPLTPKQIVNLPAKQMYKELKNMDKATANKIARYVKKTNPTLYSNLKEVVKDEKLKVTKKEIKLRNTPVAKRAKEVLKMVDELSTPQEKNKLYKELKEKGIITESVHKEVKKMLAQRKALGMNQ